MSEPQEYDEIELAKRLSEKKPRKPTVVIEREDGRGLAEGEITEIDENGNVIGVVDTSGKQDMAYVSSCKAKPPARTKLDRRINVTKVCNEHGFNPVETMIKIARNEWQELGLQKAITAHEINSASQTLLSYIAPTLKSVDYIDPDEEIGTIPTFVPSRGLLPNKDAPRLEQETDDPLDDIPSLGNPDAES